jgi:aryl-phospho-beta-D-glucosidase BglC (GH1 family)
MPDIAPTLLPPEKLDRRSDLSRLRGVMYGPKGKEEDIRKLAEWKATLIRWQFYWYDGSFPERRLDLERYDRWLEETMAEVDRLLPLCEKLGIRVVIDLHTPPGGSESGQWAMFQQEAYQKKFIAVWDKLAAHYKDKPSIWGYDLVNEPVEGKVADGLMDWRTLAEHVAKRIRAIDSKRAIIIEPGPHGGWANLPFFEPIPVPGIVYSIHMYEPMFFTHQGVLDGMPAGVSYPGPIRGEFWDKEKLRKTLETVRDYQKDYNVPIYVGEFSAPRWAPEDSAAHYLRDCIALFEEFGWDWSYHAFREWHAWNVELGSDKKDQTPATIPTSRQETLLEGFSKSR